MTKKTKINKKSFGKNFKNYDLKLHGVRLPKFKIEPVFKEKIGLSSDCENFEFLRGLCYEGFKKLNLKKGSELYDSYAKRVKYELDILKELGFTDYILLVWNVVNFCRVNDIPVGPGRGSATGSIVLYLINVTKLDPVRYDLFFERFVSRSRAKKKVVDGVTYLDGSLMCDVDLDICYDNRYKVIDFLRNEFQGRSSKISTLSTLSSKILIKDCGKIIGAKTEPEMNMVSSYIPKIFGNVADLQDAYDEVDEFRKWCNKNHRIFKTALKLRGLVRQKGVHASGILVSHDPLMDTCPTELTQDKDVVSGYDMDLASLVSVKLDLLGLRSATVVDEICKLVGMSTDDIDFNDEFIYQNLQDLRSPHGLFQIEAPTNYKVVRKVKPRNLEQLSAVLALARPGALDYLDQYALYTEHDTYDAVHPFFDDILSSTGGVCLYQEQMMKMAHKIGFTLDEAEILRRIVGKKKVKEVKEWKQKIADKIKENKLDEEIGDVLWKVLEDSANYSFNKSHSISYAALSAITVYLKFKYPREFFLSLLRMTRHETDPIKEVSRITREFDEFGIKLLPPHLIKSKMDFQIEGDNIRFGLLSIKGISDKTIEKIEAFRGEFSSKFDVFQASEDAKLNLGTLCALIQAGALDNEFDHSRSRMVLECQLWKILSVKEKRYAIELAEEFKYDLIAILKHLREFKDGKPDPVIKDSRYETIKKKYLPYLEIYNTNKKSERFANWYYEKTVLGYSPNYNLSDIFSNHISNLIKINAAHNTPARRNVRIVGVITDLYRGKAKASGKEYIRLTVEDETNEITCLMFEKGIEACMQSNSKLPEKENVVIINGSKADDAIFVNSIGVQNNKIYMKLSDVSKL